MGGVDQELYIGRKAQELRGLLKIKYPVAHGIVSVLIAVETVEWNPDRSLRRWKIGKTWKEYGNTSMITNWGRCQKRFVGGPRIHEGLLAHPPDSSASRPTHRSTSESTTEPRHSGTNIFRNVQRPSAFYECSSCSEFVSRRVPESTSQPSLMEDCTPLDTHQDERRESCWIQETASPMQYRSMRGFRCHMPLDE